MKKKSIEETFIMELPLKVEKFQSDELNKRFELMRRIYNSAQNKLERQYKYLLSFKEYTECNTKKEKGDFLNNHPFSFKGVFNKNGEPMKITFSEFGLKSYLADFAKKKVDSQHTYSDFGINTPMLMAMAMAIWSAWKKVIYDPKTKDIHYKKSGDLKSIAVDWEPKHQSGMYLDINKGLLNLNINGRRGQYAKYLTFPIKFGKKERQLWYEGDALRGGEESIRCLAIVRRKYNGQFRYFLQLTIRNSTPTKDRTLGKGRVAIDLGIYKIAVYTGDQVFFFPLAPNCREIDEKIAVLQRQMERSKRISNPQFYNADGTYIKAKKHEHRKWNFTKEYLKLRALKAELQRKQAAVRKQDHIDLANHLLSFGDEFVIEDNDVKAWAERKKEEKKREKEGKNLSKKGLGKPIGSHAPAAFVTLLANKVKALRGTFTKVAVDNGATDYDFINDTFTPHEMKERYITLCNGVTHQRDSLAAFNLYYIDTNPEKSRCYDRKAMKRGYKKFQELEKEALKLWHNRT